MTLPVPLCTWPLSRCWIKRAISRRLLPFLDWFLLSLKEIGFKNRKGRFIGSWRLVVFTRDKQWLRGLLLETLNERLLAEDWGWRRLGLFVAVSKPLVELCYTSFSLTNLLVKPVQKWTVNFLRFLVVRLVQVTIEVEVSRGFGIFLIVK